jgi:hypothetical protein
MNDIKNDKFDFIYSLPDSLLVEAIYLLFDKYDVHGNTNLLLSASQMYEYAIIKREDHKILPSAHMVKAINYKAKIDFKEILPYFNITQYDCIGRIHISDKFTLPSGINAGMLFDDYYTVCVRLNRKIVIPEILS